jgi:hypothetical protein
MHALQIICHRCRSRIGETSDEKQLELHSVDSVIELKFSNELISATTISGCCSYFCGKDVVMT